MHTHTHTQKLFSRRCFCCCRFRLSRSYRHTQVRTHARLHRLSARSLVASRCVPPLDFSQVRLTPRAHVEMCLSSSLSLSPRSAAVLFSLTVSRLFLSSLFLFLSSPTTVPQQEITRVVLLVCVSSGMRATCLFVIPGLEGATCDPLKIIPKIGVRPATCDPFENNSSRPEWLDLRPP